MPANLISHLAAEAKVTVCIPATVDGQATTSGSILDMSGYDSVMFIAKFDDVDNTSVLTLRAQQDVLNGADAMATLTGSATFTAGASDADDNVLILDIHRPRDRYVRPQVIVGTANATIACVLGVQYNARNLPVTQSADVLDTELLETPAE